MANKDQALPFTKDYVIQTTVRHMVRSIDLSMRKTMDRIPEFSGDPEKSHEVFETLATLQSLRKQLTNAREQNCVSN